MICQSCGAESSGAKFCPECGMKLAAQTTCSACGTAYSSKFCPECGSSEPVLLAKTPKPPAHTLETQPQSRLEQTVTRLPEVQQEATYTYQHASAEAGPQAGGMPVIIIKNENTVANVNENTSANVNENTNANVNTNTPVAYNAPAVSYNAPAWPAPAADGVSSKSRLAALLWGGLMGFFGGHHFYSGRFGMGLLYLCTFGLAGLGWIVDVILIASGNYKDRWGRRIVNWTEPIAPGQAPPPAQNLPPPEIQGLPK